MDLSLPEQALAWQRRAKSFAEEQPFPNEVELELNGAQPRRPRDRLHRAVKEHGLNGINHAREVGGRAAASSN